MKRQGGRRTGQKAASQQGRSGGKRRRTLAQQADKFECYERSVQAPEVDAQFIARTFRRQRGREARVLREDFCGTAALCAHWVKRSLQNRAYGIDLHRPTLEWGIKRNIVPLGRRAAGITLIQRDVRDPMEFTADVVAAFNFSYFTFQEAAMLKAYFAAVRRGLAPDGILFLDLYGGPHAMELREESTRQRGFTYIWDQAAFNPITHEALNHIHFEFPDGSALRRAFTYHWRLWQIPEVRAIALAAGFKDCVIYWEGTERETGEGNGVFRPSNKGDNAPAFVSYLLCLK